MNQSKFCEIDQFSREYELDDEKNDRHRSSFKVKPLLQIMCYHPTNGQHKTHGMNAQILYEKGKSRELIVAFDKQCMCISYKSIKSQRPNLAKLTVLQSLPVAVPLPSHFDTQSFTIVALDSFESADRNRLLGMKHAHDTVVKVFHVNPSTMKSKPTMRSAGISSIKNHENLKCKEILRFYYNQKLPLERTFLIGQELYTNPQKADNAAKMLHYIREKETRKLYHHGCV